MNSFTTMSDGILEWELTLPSEKLMSHAWYHGALSRTDAENLLQEDRQFLVRESTSQRDNYVLSCRSNGQHLHFVIQKIEINADTVYKRCQYQFEDEAYDQIPDLITSYVGSGKPISAASGARIQYPINRTVPLSQYVETEPTKDTNLCTEELVTLIAFYHAIGRKNNIPQRARSGGNCVNAGSVGIGGPPKPARNEAPRPAGRQEDASHQPSGSDSGNTSGDSTHSVPAADPAPTHVKLSDYNYKVAEEKLIRFGDLSYQVSSLINLNDHQSLLMGSQHFKALESEVMSNIKYLLRTAGPRILANHLTKVDSDFLYQKVLHIDGLDETLPVIEMCFLPQGTNVRMDILDRLECFRMMVAVTILTCLTDDQRADVINDWILLAVEVKNALGNIYGFTAIMLGLTTKEVEDLSGAWVLMRSQHTQHAVLYESQLRPIFNSLLAGNPCLPPNTTVPNVFTTVLCFKMAEYEDFASTPSTESLFKEYFDQHSQISYVEMCSYLTSALVFTIGKEDYIKNARQAIQAKSVKLDPKLLELFQVEFHMKFLWGTNANGPRDVRYSRMRKAMRFLYDKTVSEAVL